MDAEDFWRRCDSMALFPRDPQIGAEKAFALGALKGKMRKRTHNRIDATISIGGRNVTATLRHKKFVNRFIAESAFHWKQAPTDDELVLLMLSFPPCKEEEVMPWCPPPAGVPLPRPVHSGFRGWR
jgi:hypothetical protein